MNQKPNHQAPGSGEHEAGRLKELIDGIVQCCQERQLLEARIFGLPPAELRCLLLFAHERYLTAKGMASVLGVNKSRMSTILYGLEAKGLIRRSQDPNDGRVKLWTLSPQGGKKAREVESSLAGLHAKVLDELEPEQRRGILASLEVLWSAMETVKQGWKEEVQ